MSENSVLDVVEEFLTTLDIAEADQQELRLTREQVSELLAGIEGLTDMLSGVTRSSMEARVAAQATIQQQEFALVQSELERDQLVLLNMRQAALIRELREEIALSATEIDELYAELEEGVDESEPGVIVEHGDSPPVPGGARDNYAVSANADGCVHCTCFYDGLPCCNCARSPDPKAA